MCRNNAKQTLVGCEDVENHWLLLANINNNDICIQRININIRETFIRLR